MRHLRRLRPGPSIGAAAGGGYDRSDMLCPVTMKKPLALTLLLATLPIPFLLPGLVRRLGGPGTYRHLLLWGLPLAAALVAAALSLRRRRGLLFGGSRPMLLRLAPWCAAAFIVDYSFLGF